jgi:bifunctional non-homologous end joining protein LigD
MMRSAYGLGFIKPELPTLVPEPLTGEGWIHEIKYDGYRTLIIIDQGRVRAFSRQGRDWTGPYRRVADACARLPCRAAILDGEIVVQDENGKSDFEALRSAIYKAPHRIVFFAFDLLSRGRPGSEANTAQRETGSAPEADRARSPVTGPFQRPRRL